MKKILLYLLFSQAFYCQVGIGNTNPKGVLDLRGNVTNDLGLVLPETSNISNMKTPHGDPLLEGTLVWDNQEKCVKFKTVTAWSKCMVTKDDVTTNNNPGTVADIAGDGRVPARVKLNAQGVPLYSVGQGSLSFINNSNDNLFGAGKNNRDFPPLTQQVGNKINPVFVSNTKFISHSLGGYDSSSDTYLFSIGVTETGDVYVSGSNKYGQLGTGNENTVKNYTNITNLLSNLLPGEKVIKVIAGGSNSVLLTNMGNVLAAGYNYYGGNANGVSANSYQNTFKKVLFRTNDQTADTDKFITDIFASSTSSECFTAVSSTNKVFAWGRLLGTGLISTKPMTGNSDGDFGTAATNAFDAQYTKYLTNVTLTFQNPTDKILPVSKVKKFITGTGVSYLLLEDGRLFGVGYSVNIDTPYTTSSNLYITTPKLLNQIFFPQGNYQNNSIIADDHKMIDITYSTVLHSDNPIPLYSYVGDMFSATNYFYYQNGKVYAMAVTKKDIFYKGVNYDDNIDNGARLGNGSPTDNALMWKIFDKASSEFSNLEIVAVQADILKSIVAVKRPTETAADGVRLYSAGLGKDGDAGSTVKDAGSALVYKPVSY